MFINNKTKYYQLISNTLLFALGNIGSKFLVFVLMPLYTNKLTTAEYGISELVLTGTNLLIPFVSVSIQDATLRFALDKRNKIGEVLKNTVLVVVIASVITCALYPVLGLYKAISKWTGYFVIITIAYMIRNVFSIFLKAKGETKLFAIDSVLYTLYLMLFNILFLSVFNMGLKGYFLAIVISSFISLMQLSVFGKVYDEWKNNGVNRTLLFDMLKFSAPMILNNISWWVINSSDKIMIEYFDSASSSGIYSVASKIPSLIITLTNIFNQAWIISSVTEYDDERDSSFFSQTFTVFNCMLVIASSAIVLIIKPFMSVYVGKSFVQCWIYVPFLLLGSIFQSYAAYFGAIYTSAKKNISVMLTTMVAAIVNIAFNILLIPTIGIQGAVAATAIAYFAVFIFRMIDSQKYIKFSIDYKRVLFSIMLLTLQCYLVIKIEGKLIYVVSSIILIIIVLIYGKTIETSTKMMLSKLKSKKKS